MIKYLIGIQVSTAVYLQFFQADEIFAPILVLIHIIAGILVPIVYYGKPGIQDNKNQPVIITFVFVLATGIGLMVTGVTGFGQLILGFHIIASLIFVIFAFQLLSFDFIRFILVTGALLIIMVIAGVKDWSTTDQEHKIADFFPSPGSTQSGNYITAAKINRSARCGTSGCHPDIYQQWSQSAHRFSSFNNPFYKASVDYLLSTSDTTTVRWCGSCHDPVMLYSGLMVGTPDVNLPEANSGITCEICHGIIDIPDITGNANYVLNTPIEYPFSHSKGMLAAVNRMLIRLKPEAHRKAMLQPLHKSETFCATCHKVSLDVPINHYKWLRGQDEYDAWQASGVSYNAVASFYNPPKSLTCQSCHMAREKSNDRGNDYQKVFGHFFPAANTALPSLIESKNDEWLNRTSQFLQDDRINIDIFGAIIDSKLIAPLEDQLQVKPGQQVRFEVIVRTKKIGHTFPGGTIDSNEPWLEIIGTNENGDTFFSSGAIQSDKSVDPAAHFFRGILLDGEGKFIQKRNPHEWRTTLYNNSIPPGSADVIHFVWTVPEDFNSQIKLIAKVNYRKFNRSITIHSLENPIELPIVKMAEDHLTISAIGQTKFAENSGLRFNDYGIALLRQNNLEGARLAFVQVTRLMPGYADGFVNLARVLIKTGEFEDAEYQLNTALELKPGFPKAKYFQALIAKTKGDYKQALTLFAEVRLTNPNDRVMLRHFGQTHFFAENWEKAKLVYSDVLRIDPEDAEAHYNLMLLNRKLVDLGQAKYHSEKYLKYKPDEQARSISQITRLRFPHANNEAQLVHSHVLSM